MRLAVLSLASLLLACDEKDTGAWFDSTVDTAPEDTSVEITTASVEIINETGYSIFYIYQCQSEGDVCVEEVGGTLPDGDSMVFEVDPGWWETFVVDEYDGCAFTGDYQLFAGDFYSWRVRETVGTWNGTRCKL